jgi:hypothetical protein
MPAIQGERAYRQSGASPSFDTSLAHLHHIDTSSFHHIHLDLDLREATEIPLKFEVRVIRTLTGRLS